MQIQLRLYGALRELLPPEKKGRDQIALADGTTVRQLLAQLGAPEGLLVALNGEYEVSHDRPLQDGDEIAVFLHAAGGEPEEMRCQKTPTSR